MKNVKTKRSIISCKSFLTESNHNISFTPLHSSRLTVLALLAGYAFVMAFYWASTAIERWQFVAIIFVILLVLIKGFSRYFYCSNEIALSAFLPSKTLMWQGKTYTLLPSCRYGFIGFWFALTPISPIENEKVYFFIPRFLLSSADISFLSFLICASDNNAVSDISS